MSIIEVAADVCTQRVERENTGIFGWKVIKSEPWVLYIELLDGSKHCQICALGRHNIPHNSSSLPPPLPINMQNLFIWIHDRWTYHFLLSLKK